MINVHLDSPTNSTIFTNCCNVAILEHQAVCPRCKQEVYPGQDATEQERNKFRWSLSYGRQKGGQYP